MSNNPGRKARRATAKENTRIMAKFKRIANERRQAHERKMEMRKKPSEWLKV